MTDLVSTTTRSHKALDAPPPSGLTLRCRYESCEERFNTHEEITKHMYEDLAHPFCSRCKKQFENKSSYFEHKISSALHFMCPVCLTDFQSKTGRDYHMRKTHPPEQQLTCQGCEEVFPSGSSMMQHVEAGSCPGISLTRLVMEQSRRQNAHSLLETAPREFMHSKSSERTMPVEEQAPLPAIEMSGALQKGKKTRGTPMKPISFPNKAASVTYTASNSTPPAQPFAPPIRYANHGNQRPDAVSQGISTVSLLMSDSEDATLSKWPALSPTIFSVVDKQQPVQDLILFGDDDSNGEPEDKPAKSISSASLRDGLQDLNLNPKPNQIQTQIQNQNHPTLPLSEQPANPHTELTPAKLDPEQYINPETTTYTCICGYRTQSRESFSSHISEERRWANAGVATSVCPQCNKAFASTSALVGHMETAQGRCSIRLRKVFGRAIDDATGGLLGVAGEQAGVPVLATRKLEGMHVSAAPLEMRVEGAGRAEGMVIGDLVRRDLQGG